MGAVGKHLSLITEEHSKLPCLVDTGNQCTLWPADSTNISKTTPDPTIRLEAANSTAIPAFGRQDKIFQLGGKQFKWQCIIAKVKHQIIELDFLRHFNFVIDLDSNILEHRQSQTVIAFTNFHGPVISNISLVIHPRTEAIKQSLQQNYPGLLDTQSALLFSKHGVQCHIPTTGPLIKCRPCRLTPEKEKFTREYFLPLLEKGIMRRSSSQWASPLHMVKKPDGSYRPCGDYRRLNISTSPYSYPILTSTISHPGLRGAQYSAQWIYAKVIGRCQCSWTTFQRQQSSLH